MFICRHCGEAKKNANSLRNHERLCKFNPNKQASYVDLNQDKLAERRKVLGYTNAASKAKALGKEFTVSEETKRKISEANTGRTCSEETKRKNSEFMKKAHAEGRAWNIGNSRWKNQPSWPEQFFMQVIENEFVDKNYTCEYPLGIYSIDFAWVEKKLAIEIDGEQHQRFKEYRERDERKNRCLSENGWRVLRISWKDMFNDTKTWIEKAKTFIEE
jgi:very-short-patch-repair endonuclease